MGDASAHLLFYGLILIARFKVRMVARSKTRSSRKSRNLGNYSRGYSPPSFPFCTIPKTENSEMKTSEIFSEVFSSNSDQTRGFPTPSFPFCTTLKTENSEMKTSEFSLRPFDQTQRFSISEFFGLGYTVEQKRNLGVGKTRSLSKLHSLVKKSLFG